MLAVRLNKANFEYDVHSIVKAFYPEEAVHVLTPETGEKKNSKLEAAVSMELMLTEEGARLITYAGPSGDGLRPCAGDTAEPLVMEWQWDRTDGDTYKNDFKRFLYRSLSRLTGRTLPWGNLTGIRPTKIAYGMLEEGKTEEEIFAFYREKHFVSPQKSRLSIEIAKRERELLSGLHYEKGYSRGYSLYVGIPFCPTTCLYCSFTSFAIGAYRKQVEAYISCLIREMEYVSDRFKNRILDSVYIGGGTPTTLEPEQLERLLGSLKRLFDFSHVKEFTVEAGRADSITKEKLQVLYRYGVTRISINPQTMKQETLNMIGRRHTVEQVVEAYRLARETGFTNINMDLILGLPGETAQDVQHTIDRVTELAPDSLTVHSLAIKRASRLNQWIQENGVTALRNTDETMAIAARGAALLGMEPYYLYRQKNMSGNFENVGYALPGKFGLYNILIMEEKQTIMALGAGSISKRVYPEGRIERCDNVKDVAQYIERIDEMIERKERLILEKSSVKC